MALLRTLIGGLVGGVLANNPAIVCFGIGVVAGIYCEQTYHLPSIDEFTQRYLEKLKQLEKEQRK